jgi:ribosome-associated protein
MKKAQPGDTRIVYVEQMPIELCQFLKFAGLTESGGEAKQLIADGGVLLNGSIETRKRKKMDDGDVVVVSGESVQLKAR